MGRIRIAHALLVLVVLIVPATAWATHSFDDVPDGRFFTDPVEWAAENGITTGRTPTIFDPNAPVTRGESVTFLKRYHDNIATGLDTDTLGALGCASDQVAIDDGGWRCATPRLERVLTGPLASTLVDTADLVGEYTSIAIGVDGDAIIAHRNASSPALELFLCHGTACTSGSNEVLVAGAGGVGYFLSLAIGENGNPVISHHNLSNGSLEAYVCGDERCATGTNQVLVDTADTVGWHTAIAIGANGNPVISHHNLSDDSLELFVCADPTCAGGTVRTLVDTAETVGHHTSVAIGTDGNPVISHHNVSDSSLELYTCGDPSCSTGTNRVLVDTTDTVGQGTAITIGADGNPVISHYNFTEGSLEAYLCATPTCGTGTNRVLADTKDAIGQYSSIAIDLDDNPVISHRNSTDGNLELYTCADPSCESGSNVVLVTTADSVGLFTSIAITAENVPIVSHNNTTDKSLEVVTLEYHGAGIVFD